jgi:DNA-binding response OmpR family regulator
MSEKEITPREHACVPEEHACVPEEHACVLLVEDNAKILEINRRLLEKDGLLVLTAKTLAEARERLKIALPDVVVLDIMLPDGSGLDFLPELRELCGAPVLFLTAKAERADVLAGLTAGGNDYITKPYDIDEFRMRVTGFLRLVRPVQTRRSASTLTEKELAVAMLAARGMINKDIADKVCLSESRVKTCLSGIYRKLGLQDKDNKRELLAEMLKC